jgi:hypothetical protein
MEFDGYSVTFIKQVVSAGGQALKETIDSGAEYMRKFILEGSPTGSPWHDNKNARNGYPQGSRIGNTDPSIGDVHMDAGNMLREVDALGPAVSPDNSKIVGLFGWIDSDKVASNAYFVEQDSGNYHTGKHIGMGLLNSATGDSRGVLQNFGAMMAARNQLETSMKSKGFRSSGESELF